MLSFKDIIAEFIFCYNESSNIKNLFQALPNKTLIKLKEYYLPSV